MKTMRSIRSQAAWLLCLLLAVGFVAQLLVLPVSAATNFTYQHDPRLNSKVMEDVVLDPDAPYGYKPSTTGSLREYAENFDWDDPVAVAKGRQERIAYHTSVRTMYDMLLQMKDQGKSMEEIARAVSAERNALRIASYEGDPEGLAAMKARNLEVYGREEGPTPDEMYEKYGAWETVIEKAFSVNMGLDVCLGLYDEYYPIYLALGQIPDEETQVSTREFAVASFIRSSGMDMTSASDSVLARFSDADAITPWFRTEMATAVAGGIIKGYDTGVLCPGEGIRRIEAFVILSRCLPDLQADREAIPFTDVPAWAKADLDRLSGAGLVLGYGNNTLGADDQLTVEQVGILAARLQLMLDL